MSDFWTVFTFSAPTLNLSTQVRAGTTTLWLRQWSGTDVGSGGAVWGASRRLIQYLEAHGDGAPAVPSAAEGEAAAIAVPSRTVGTLRLIELGSGTGAAGLAAAALGFAHVTLSDQASFCFPNAPGEREAPARSLLDLARTNLELNIGAINSAQSDSISSIGRTHPTGANSADADSSLAGHAPAADAPVAAVAQLLWGDEADHAALPHAKYDVVLGSDVLLFTSAMLPLLATLRRVSHEGRVSGSKECRLHGSHSSPAWPPGANDPARLLAAPYALGGAPLNRSGSNGRQPCGREVTEGAPTLRPCALLCTPGTVVLFEHTDRGLWEGDYLYPLDLARFLAAVEAEGRWESTVVRDVGRHITLRMVRRSKARPGSHTTR